MKKEGYSRPGLFGTMNHYDNRGQQSRTQPPWIIWKCQHI